MNKYKSQVEYYRARCSDKAAVVGAAILGASVSAHAELPAAATTAFTSIGTAVTDVLAAVWPIVGLSVAGFGLIKLFKKGAGKAI